MRLRAIAATATAALVTPLLLTIGATPASAVPASAASEVRATLTVAPGSVVAASSGTQTWPLFKIVYSSTVYELVTQGDGTQVAVPLTFEKWRDAYHYAAFSTAPTTFVKYGWSPTVYAVTFWPGGEARWQWERLTFDIWAASGYPTPRDTGGGWLVGSTYYRWSTGNELFVAGEDGVTHKLTVQEWAASGYRAFTTREGGFYKRLSAPEIFRGSSSDPSSLTPVTAAEWAAAGFPTPTTLPELSQGTTTDGSTTTAPPPTSPTTTPPPTSPAPTPPPTSPTATPPPPTSPTTAMPDATNTGVPAGTKLTVYNGSLTITQPGTVIDGLDIRGFVKVKAKDVTIKNSIVRGVSTTVGQGLVTSESTGSLTIVDSELFNATPNWYVDGLRGSNITARRLNIHDVIDTMHVYGDNVTLESSWLHDTLHYADDPSHPDGSHDDNLQIVKGNNIRLTGNRLEGAYNAAVMFTQGSGIVSNVTMDKNYFGGGACTINIAESGLGAIQGLRFTNNTFGTDSRKACNVISPATTTAVTTYSNNVDTTGKAIVVKNG